MENMTCCPLHPFDDDDDDDAESAGTEPKLATNADIFLMF